MLKRIYIAWLKWRMKRVANHLMYFYFEQRCGNSVVIDRKFSKLNEKLKAIDPNHPANRG